MFGIGGFELFIILLFGFLVFGPDKLPEIARMAGEALNKFKKAQDEMRQVIDGEVLNPQSAAKAQAHREQMKAQSEAGTSAPVKESFAERKARYMKQREEEERQQQIEANRAAMRREHAPHANDDHSDDAPAQVENDANSSTANIDNIAATAEVGAGGHAADADKNASDGDAQPKPRGASRPLPSYTAEELYGIKPVAAQSPKSAAKKEEV